ncbi:MAG: molybdopterin-dependent oxidoreductase [Myxococcaceae bacterium]|nr:molybdopterin-dependent oxidoreductase [Myxococcaceae bacterium]
MRRTRPLSRRRLLLGAGAAGLAACDSSNPHAGFLGAMERFNLRVQSGLLRPGLLAPTEPEGSFTPEEAFPDYFISPTVPLPPPDWALEVGGMVARPRTFTVEDLTRMPRTDLRVRHHCVEGWSAVASWHGVQLRELASIVGADPRAPCLEFRSFDSGYWSTWDRESALHPQSILAYGMNGEPLLPGHGAPLRLYAAVKLGYKMVKYLTEVN